MTEWAIRHPKLGKAHRDGERRSLGWNGERLPITFCSLRLAKHERVPLDQVPAADRCRICWKDET